MSHERGGRRREWLDARAFNDLSEHEAGSFIRRGLGPVPSPAAQTRIILTLGRLRTCGVGMLSMALGIGLSGGRPSLRTALLLIIAGSFSFIANVENAFTDVAEDFKNLPGRVYNVARLGNAVGTLWLVALHVLVLAMAGYLGVVCLALTALGLLLASQYSYRPLRAKARPVAGLMIFSLAVAYPPLLAPFAVAEPATLSAWVSAVSRSSVWSLSTYLAVWFLAKGLFKNIPDFLGDRDAGVKTSATVFASYESACLVATLTTIIVYWLPVAGSEFGVATVPPLAAVMWFPLATTNALLLLLSRPGLSANTVLGRDMYLSAGYLATCLLLVAPPTLLLVVAVPLVLLFLVSDLFGLDSRRDNDVRA